MIRIPQVSYRNTWNGFVHRASALENEWASKRRDFGCSFHVLCSPGKNYRNFSSRRKWGKLYIVSSWKDTEL